MGNTQAHETHLMLPVGPDKFVADIRNALENGSNPAGTVGGAENFEGGQILGGADVLKDYANSIYSQHKEKIIRNIAAEVFAALKIQASNYARTAPIDKVVEKLAEVVPNKKNGKSFSKSFKKSASSQKHVCDVLVTALNKNYGGQIVRSDASDAEKCQKVAEVMHTLLVGLNSEFMSVASDLTRSLQNMQTLHDALNASYERQKKIAIDTGDIKTIQDSKSIKELHVALMSELKRQMALVANLVNSSIGSTGKSVVELLAENKDFLGVVSDLKGDSGTTEFADRLQYLLLGMNNVAYSANLVEKALKILGMSVRDFKASKTPSELRARIYDVIQKRNPKSHELDRLMAAAEVIRKYDYKHSEIAKVIKGGNSEDMNEDADMNMVEGGVDVAPRYWEKKSLTKKIDRRDKYRDQILKDFRTTLRAHFRMIVESADLVSQEVGKSIPITDDLRRFAKVFSTLDTLNEENLHEALSGYYKDVSSKNRREKFLNNYELVLLTIEPLMKGPGGNHFKSLYNAIREIIKTIDGFANKIVNSISELHFERPDEIKDALARVSSDVFGSGAEDDTFGRGSFVDFERARNVLHYNISISNIKSNLLKTSADIQEYGKGYEDMLGEEAGWLINKIKSEFSDLLKAVDESKAAPAGAAIDAKIISGYNIRLSDTLSGAGAANLESHKAALKHLFTQQMKAKVGMVEAAQAIDLYLKSFANGIAKNPDSVRSVVKMLDQVEYVAKWFTDRSGDNLAAVFESFPSGIDNTPAMIQGTKDINRHLIDGKQVNVKEDKADHYYVWLENKHNSTGNTGAAGNELEIKANPQPGNPMLGMVTNTEGEKKIIGLIKLTKKAAAGVHALENLLSAFSSVGAKLGDVEPLSDTFMTPGQIFNNIIDYIVASSFTSGYNPIHHRHNNGAAPSIITEAQVSTGGAPAAVFPSHDNAFYRTAATPISHNTLATSLKQYFMINGMNDANSTTEEKKITDDIFPTNRNTFGIISGTATAAQKYTSVAMASIQPYNYLPEGKWVYGNYSNRDLVRLDHAGWVDRFYDTDLLFEMTLKSIVCKVLTVVDAYRLFHRPTLDRRHSDSLNPLRVILGGNDFEGGAARNVKIIPEALELYFRLPLLAEWYRDMMGLRGRQREADGDGYDFNLNNEHWVLSIVPSVDGVWSDFLRVMFDKTEYVSEGNYTESQIQEIISSINNIYNAYKGRTKATVRDIINGFVLEINRVFGFLRREDIKKYFEYKNGRYRNDGYMEGEMGDDFTNFDILNATDQFGRGKAPSDRFVTQGDYTAGESKQRTVAYLLRDIEKMRKKMDEEFRNAVSTNSVVYEKPSYTSFYETIKNHRRELNASKTPADQYNTVLRLMQGTNRLMTSTSEKYIVFHETVIAPLYLLNRLGVMLTDINNTLHGLSHHNISGFAKYISEGKLNAAITDGNEVSRDYSAFLQTKYPEEFSGKNTILMYIAETLGGIQENKRAGVFSATGYVDLTTQIDNRDPENATLSKIKWDLIYATFLNILTELQCNPNGLVSVSVGSTGDINVDFSPLQDAFTELLQMVKSNINKLRIEFATKPELLGVCSERLTYLEENVVEALFNNKYGYGLDPAVTVHLRSTIRYCHDMTDGKLYSVFAKTLYWDPVGAANAGMRDDMKDKTFCSYTHNNVTSFPFNVAGLTIEPDYRSAEHKGALAQILSNADLVDNAQKAALNQICSIPVMAFTSASRVFSEPNLMDPNDWSRDNLSQHSLIMCFNKILHNYLNDNLDDGTMRFYLPLIENFMNGAAALENLQGRAFPNVLNRQATGKTDNKNAYYENTNNNTHHIGVPTSIIWHSSVIVMKQYANAIDQRMKRKRHAYEGFSEIPEYMRERMRANLPYYSKLFEAVRSRAEFLRSLLSNSEMKESLNLNFTGAFKDKQSQQILVNGSAALVDPSSLPDKRAHFLSLLNMLIEKAISIKRCCDGVYKELQDTAPYFMETQRDFINDYKQRHGFLPFMPASSILLPLDSAGKYRKYDREEGYSPELLLPSKSHGSDVYKFNYAARLVLGRNDVTPTMDHFPGAKQIYQDFTAISSHEHKLSAMDYASTVRNFVSLARFAVDGAVYSNLFSVYNNPNMADETKVVANVAAAAAANNPTLSEAKNKMLNTYLNPFTSVGDDINLLNLYKSNHDAEFVYDAIYKYYRESKNSTNNILVPYQFQSPSQRETTVIGLTETPNLKQKKVEFVKSLHSINDPLTLDRKAARTHNILDLDIVPINVHAFMREIPFINLLNYSYTFDRMVHDFVLPSYERNNDPGRFIKPNDQCDSTRELMVKLLVHPYASLTAGEKIRGKQYYALLASLFNGNDNLRLGRPKYLSDQLWHKVLLTSSTQIANRQSVLDSGAKINSIMALEAGPSAYEAQRAISQYLTGQVAAASVDTVKNYKNVVLRHIEGKFLRGTAAAAVNTAANGPVERLKELNNGVTHVNANHWPIVNAQARNPETDVSAGINDYKNFVTHINGLPDSQKAGISIPYDSSDDAEVLNRNNALHHELKRESKYIHDVYMSAAGVRTVYTVHPVTGDDTVTNKLLPLMKSDGDIAAAAPVTINLSDAKINAHLVAVKNLYGYYSRILNIYNFATENKFTTAAAAAIDHTTTFADLRTATLGMDIGKDELHDSIHSEFDDYTNGAPLESIFTNHSLGQQAAIQTLFTGFNVYSADPVYTHILAKLNNAWYNLGGGNFGVLQTAINNLLVLNLASLDALTYIEVVQTLKLLATHIYELTLLGQSPNFHNVRRSTISGFVTKCSDNELKTGVIAFTNAAFQRGVNDNGTVSSIINLYSLINSDLSSTANINNLSNNNVTNIDGKFINRKIDVNANAFVNVWNFLIIPNPNWVVDASMLLSNAALAHLCEGAVSTSNFINLRTLLADILSTQKNRITDAVIDAIFPTTTSSGKNRYLKSNVTTGVATNRQGYSDIEESLNAVFTDFKQPDTKYCSVNLYNAYKDHAIRLMRSPKSNNVDASSAVVLTGRFTAAARTSLAAINANRNLNKYEKYWLSRMLYSNAAGAATTSENFLYADVDGNATQNNVRYLLLKGYYHLFAKHYEELINFMFVGGNTNGKQVAFIVPSDPVSTDGLKYYDKNSNEWKVSDHPLPGPDVLYCAELGHARFNTKLVRNLTWLVQAQRLARVMMVNHLDFLDTPVVRGLKIANPQNTEYESNETYDKNDFNGSKFEMF